MIKEAYCSFEVAKLLKEKGFEGDINAYYHIWDNGNKVCSVQEFSHSEAPHLYIPTPTHQMAMAWLREVYGISIEISALKRYRWVYTIYRLFEERVVEVWNDGTYVSYEDATDDALKYCLENLNKLI